MGWSDDPLSACVIPLRHPVWQGARNRLGANPVEYVTQQRALSAAVAGSRTG